MIEVLLNATKVFLSKDARDTATGLLSLFEKSEDWKQDICTIEARVSVEAQERALLIRDIIADKMKSLKYARSAVSACKITFSELVHNAFEHGTKSVRKKIIRIVADVSPTFITLSVYNPSKAIVDLDSWFSAGAKQLRDTSFYGGGRGLISAYRRSDNLEQVGKYCIKATIYRDRVRFEKYSLDDTVLVIAVSGHSNPSFGRRLVEFVEDIDTAKLVVCLKRIDPNEFTSEEMRDFGAFVRRCEADREAPIDDDDDGELLDTVNFGPILSFASQQAELNETDIRIVCDDGALIDLLPRDLVTRSVMGAIDSLKTA